MVAGVTDEFTESTSSKFRVSSEGQAEVGGRLECNRRGDNKSESVTTN